MKIALVATILVALLVAQDEAGTFDLPLRFDSKRDSVGEISGLALSIRNPGWIWSHEDSGNAAKLIALDSRGRIRFRYDLRGARNFDWEDIATAVDARTKHAFIVVGDVGRNLAKLGQTAPRLWVTREPDIATDLQPPAAPSPGAKSEKLRRYKSLAVHDWRIRYAALEPKDYPDVEALYFDDRAQRFGLVTKSSRGRSVIWSVAPPANWSSDATVEAIQVATLRLRGSNREQMVTAADLDTENRRLVLTSYRRLMLLPAPILDRPTASDEELPRLVPAHSEKLPKLDQIEALVVLPKGRVLVASEGKTARFAVLTLPAPASSGPKNGSESRPTKEAGPRKPPE